MRSHWRFAACWILALLCSRARAQEPLYTVPGDSGAQFGAAIASIGDVDGDGISDLIVGAPASGKGAALGGEAQLLSGRGGALIREFLGSQTNGRFGCSAVGTGDLNGDGVPDLMVGAFGEGCVYVYSGSDGALLQRLCKGNDFGFTVSGVSDLDFDGVPDLLVGAPYLDKVFVFSGASQQPLYTLSRPYVRFGQCLAPLGDVDGDGAGDFAIGAPRTFDQGHHLSEAGAIHICSGASGAILRTFLGVVFDENLGWDLRSVPDQDGDGDDDLFAASPGDPVMFKVISSRDGNRLLEFAPILRYPLFPDPHVVKPADLNGDGNLDWMFQVTWWDFASNPIEETYFVSGSSRQRIQILTDFENAAEPLGDVNGDGRAELAARHAPSGTDRSDLIVLLGNDLYLHVDPKRVVSGDAIAFVTREGLPGQPTLLVIENVNGLPIFAPVLPVRYFDPTGGVKLTATVPPGLQGYDVTYRSYALDANDRLVTSYSALVEFR
jgi:hypothetical protein